MPFGAMETMVTHEILSEKTSMIDHFALYAAQCQDPQLKEMIQRHIQTALHSYNQLVSYTHDYQQIPAQVSGFSPIPHQALQYGLHNPAPESPNPQGARLSDKQIATSVMLAHKNSARNHMAAALECADPNVRQILMNGSVTCCNQAYEIFIYMNQRGMYQVPTMKDHTAKTLLHHYQPAPMQMQQPVTMQQQNSQMNSQEMGQQGPYRMNQPNMDMH